MDIIDSGDELFAKISIGHRKTSDPITFKFKGSIEANSEGSWKFKNQGKDKKEFRHKCEDLGINKDLDMPEDISQIPDLFIDFYTYGSFNKEKRIAYLRIPAKQIIAREETANMKPHWWKLRSPYNDTQKRKLGSLMAAFQLVIQTDKE